MNAVAVVLRNSIDCREIPIKRAAQKIVQNLDDYDSISGQCASIYIAIHLEKYSVEITQIATKHILINIDDYPHLPLARLARLFIEKNNSFFKEPMKEQNEFVLFFKERNKLNILASYSNQLRGILCSNSRLLDDYANKKISKGISIFDAWKAHDFNQVLLADKK